MFRCHDAGHGCGERSQCCQLRCACVCQGEARAAVPYCQHHVRLTPQAQAHDVSKPFAFVQTYVHRCGRTARAGKAGCAITLVRKEVRQNPPVPLIATPCRCVECTEAGVPQCDGYPGVVLPDAQGLAPNPLQDMRHFKAMLRKVDNTFVKDLTLKPEDMEALQSGTWRKPPSSCVHPMCKSAGWLLTCTCLMLCIADYEKAIAHAQVRVHLACGMIPLRSFCCDRKCIIAGHD